MRFLLMEELKNKVYQNNPHTLDELKVNIRREITAIPDEELMRVNRNFLQRCERCVAAQGHPTPPVTEVCDCCNCKFA